MKEIAQLTGGVYLRAKDTKQLDDVYRQLDQLEPVAQDAELFRPTEELYPWPLGVALFLSALLTMSLLRVPVLGRRGVKLASSSEVPS